MNLTIDLFMAVWYNCDNIVNKIPYTVQFYHPNH